MKKAAFVILIVLFIDQALKFWIKTTMTIGEEIHVMGDWFILHFTENNGMAFGIQFAGEWGKLALSIFRIIAVIAIGYYIRYLIRRKSHSGLIISMSLIFAGALGNIIDSAFYGMLFSHSSYHTEAVFLPQGGGYAPFLHGKVVDMFYFPIFKGSFPAWFPIWPNENYIFFRPVFNIADSAITIGVFMLILFQKTFFQEHEKQTITEENNSLT